MSDQLGARTASSRPSPVPRRPRSPRAGQADPPGGTDSGDEPRRAPSADGEAESKQLARQIGATIRAMRQAAGWTTQQLADAAELSQPHLSQLENGRSVPSIGALYRIARALGVGAQDLLPAIEDDVVVTRRGAGIPRPVGDEPGEPLSWFLTGAPGRLIEAHEWRFEEGRRPGGWFEHDGEDFVIVTEGTLRVDFAGGRQEELAAGDVIWYRADLAHHWESADGRLARAVLVNARRGRQAGGPAVHPEDSAE